MTLPVVFTALVPEYQETPPLKAMLLAMVMPDALPLSASLPEKVIRALPNAFALEMSTPLIPFSSTFPVRPVLLPDKVRLPPPVILTFDPESWVLMVVADVLVMRDWDAPLSRVRTLPPEEARVHRESGLAPESLKERFPMVRLAVRVTVESAAISEVKFAVNVAAPATVPLDHGAVVASSQLPPVVEVQVPVAAETYAVNESAKTAEQSAVCLKLL